MSRKTPAVSVKCVVATSAQSIEGCAIPAGADSEGAQREGRQEFVRFFRAARSVAESIRPSLAVAWSGVALVANSYPPIFAGDR